MTDDSLKTERAAASVSPTAASQALVYDFFKHFTSLSLLALGGMLTLMGSVFSEGNRSGFVLSMALISISGAVALMGQTKMVDDAVRGKTSPRIIGWYRTIVPVFFGMGVGAFLAVLQDLF